jgi:hypothetical protein
VKVLDGWATVKVTSVGTGASGAPWTIFSIRARSVADVERWLRKTTLALWIAVEAIVSSRCHLQLGLGYLWKGAVQTAYRIETPWKRDCAGH